MLYYLYYLRKKGLNNLKGVINYPLLREKIAVELNDEKEKELEKILFEINDIVNKDFPPELKKLPHCRACSYYELCWV
jgi:CRISPR-associated exonuclease Cas4